MTVFVAKSHVQLAFVDWPLMNLFFSLMPIWKGAAGECYELKPTVSMTLYRKYTNLDAVFVIEIPFIVRIY